MAEISTLYSDTLSASWPAEDRNHQGTTFTSGIGPVNTDMHMPPQRQRPHLVVHEELVKNLSPRGWRAYEKMYQASLSPGDAENKKKIPASPQCHAEVWQHKDFELFYNKPTGFLLITRKPFALNNKKTQWDQATRDNCTGWGATDVEAYIEFAQAMKFRLSRCISSKLFVFLSNKAKEAGVTYKGKLVGTIRDVYKSWTEEPMTAMKCQQVFDILYGSFEKEDIVARIQWEVLYENGLFFSHNHNAVNRLDGGEVVASNIQQLIRSKIRDIYRNKYTRADVPHGVKINISVKNREKRQARKRGKFIFKEHVKGWLEKKHLDYNRAFETGTEVTPGVEVIESGF